MPDAAVHAPLPLDPAAFGLPAGQVSLVQTHIGWVYLLGEYAFKLKKPVKFDFLDFSTLERRHWACEREVTLNRRLCPDLYLGLIPVIEDSQGKRSISLSPSSPLPVKRGGAGGGVAGVVVDWAVHMRRLPEDRMLDQLLVSNAVTVDDVERIADTLSEFYLRQRAQPFDAQGNGSLKVVRFNVEENLREGRALEGNIIADGALKLIEARALHFLNKYGSLIEQRERDGFVVDGHGDLRAENIHLPERGAPLPFDCIEFNDRFRIGDSALDVAFLAMDFDSRGREDLAAAFLKRYAQRCDPKIHPKLLNFYLGYRAFVKGKVAAWIAADKNVAAAQKEKSIEQARMLFDLAVRYTLRDEPALLVFCGPAGSGKSTLAAEFARRLKCRHIATDLVRDELVPRGEPPERRYAGHISGRVYELLCQRAAAALKIGESVVLDGTFATRDLRKRAAQTAAEANCRAVLVWADSPAAEIEKHLHARSQSGELFGSEATSEVSRKQQSTFAVPSESETQSAGRLFHALCRIDTSAPLAQSHAAAWTAVLEALAK